MDPAAVVEAVYAAVEAQDLESAGEYLAEDAVLVLLPPPSDTDGTFVGKDAVLGWFGNLIASNFAIEFSDAKVDGDRVTIKNLTWVDDLPIAPVEFDGSAIVQDGLIKTMSWVMTPETMAELGAAAEHQANMVVVERYFEELWNQGDFVGFDEIIAEDFMSHSYPMIDGDRDVLKEDIAGFRDENPNAYFTFDDITLTDDRAFVINTMMMRPEGAAANAEGEPAGSPMVLVLGLEGGKITDRWLYTHAE